MDSALLAVRRERVLDQMEEGSVMILHSGVDIHMSADGYLPFEVNKNFQYLTGIDQDHMILFLNKTRWEEPKVTLYIEEADPTMVKWYGKKLSIEESSDTSGIEDVQYLDRFGTALDRMIANCMVKTAYFDTFRNSAEDLPDYNGVKAAEFTRRFPGIKLVNAHSIIAYLRMAKDEDEIEMIKQADQITKAGLMDVLHQLKPGMYEYQVQAIFEYRCKYLGANKFSFPTIAGSGMNGTMLHYETNRCQCKDGDLILLDLGAMHRGYCSDITRTYPVNGTYSKRQRQFYEIVLRANQEVVRVAKPGMTTKELNEVCKEVLAQGLIDLGVIKEKEELFTYYMHGVSHHLGMDCHDVTDVAGEKLRPGCVISNEPGLYIDEEGIGIRIEDDLLITEDGCQVLSEDIPRTIEEIEQIMAQR